jgi:putative peptidoglycan lipid II flippase
MLAVPATIGLVLLRKPIVRVLYEGRQFSSGSTDLVAWALLWYGAGLIGHCIVEISSRAFYALHDTKTPVFVGVGAMSLNLVLSFAFTALFRRIGWMPHGGLALANSVATFIESLFLIYLLNKRMQGFDSKRILVSFIKFAIASVGMGLVIQVIDREVVIQSHFLKLGFEIISGVIVYLILIILLRCDELKSLLNLRKSKV